MAALNSNEKIILQAVGSVLGRAKKELRAEFSGRDANALLEAAAMKRLESQALAVRDRCASFLYTRTTPQVDATVRKGLPAWLS